jgi:hypothetical protein
MKRILNYTVRALLGLLLAMITTGSVLAESAAPEVPKAAVAPEKKHSTLGDLLFPNSASWTLFEDLPMAFTGDEAKADVQRLLDTMNVKTESTAEDLISYFRKVDMGGSVAVVYSGPSVKSDGYVSLVWPNYSPGSAVPDEPIGGWGEIMRVKQGPNPRVTVVRKGCCADTFEAFYREDLLNPDGAEIIRASGNLQYPDEAIDFHARISDLYEFTTRFSPAVNDTPSPDDSSPGPAIGNIARKYRGSVFDAVALSCLVDAAGKPWLLIKMTSLDDLYSVYFDPGQPPMDLGWVDASVVKSPNSPGHRLPSCAAP